MQVRGIATLCLTVALLLSCTHDVEPEAPRQGRSDKCDALAPRRFVTTGSEGSSSYERAVHEALFMRVPTVTSLNVTKIPFLLLAMVKEEPGAAPEAVYVLEEPGAMDHVVVFAQALPNPEQDIADIRVRFSEARISRRVLNPVARVWEQMVREARWPAQGSELSFIKRGGTRYTFDYFSGMALQGMVVSPEVGTCTRGLVALATLLGQLADGKAGLDSDIRLESKRLLERLTMY